jgi:hypothetical protein
VEPIAGPAGRGKPSTFSILVSTQFRPKAHPPGSDPYLLVVADVTLLTLSCRLVCNLHADMIVYVVQFV